MGIVVLEKNEIKPQFWFFSKQFYYLKLKTLLPEVPSGRSNLTPIHGGLQTGRSSGAGSSVKYNK